MWCRCVLCPRRFRAGSSRHAVPRLGGALAVLAMALFAAAYACDERAPAPLDWTEVIGLGAGEPEAADLKGLLVAAASLRAPGPGPLSTAPGYTYEEYLSGSAKPVQREQVRERPLDPPYYKPPPGLVAKITFCEHVSDDLKTVNEKTEFSAGVWKIEVLYQLSGSVPRDSELWVVWYHDGAVVLRAPMHVYRPNALYPDGLTVRDRSALEPGVYEVELRLDNEVQARAGARVAGPSPTDLLMAYDQQLDRLRRAAGPVLKARAADQSAAGQVASLLATLAERYLGLAYRSYLRGPGADNRRLEAKGLLAAGLLRAAYDLGMNGMEPAQSEGYRWIRRAAAILPARGSVSGEQLSPAEVTAQLSRIGKHPVSPKLPSPGSGSIWALIVGVNKYSTSFQLPTLQFAAADAELLGQALQSLRGGDLPREQVRIMTDSGLHEYLPTRGNIVSWLDYMAQRVGPEDTFVFYFAGHGMMADGGEYLLPMDASIAGPGSLARSALSLALLKEKLAALSARNTIAIIDACRDTPLAATEGAGLEEALAKSLKSVGQKSWSQHMARAVLLSCGVDQRAWEWEEKGHGVFTYYLAQGLSGEAAAADGSITFREVASYVREQVPAWVSQHLPGKSQMPEVDPADPPEIVLRPKREGTVPAPAATLDPAAGGLTNATATPGAAPP